jgi:hypothetical protein
VTHDELLAKVNEGELGWYYGWMQDALRAVVELHKPCQIKNSMTYCEGCSNSAFFPWDSCPTIQAIEKELG